MAFKLLFEGYMSGHSAVREAKGSDKISGSPGKFFFLDSGRDSYTKLRVSEVRVMSAGKL